MNNLFYTYSALAEFIISPLGQIVVWGTTTFLTFIYVVYSTLEQSYERGFDGWRITTAGLITVLWTINISLWFSATMHWMLFSDLFFIVICYWIFRLSKGIWAYDLTGLYITSFALDLAFWNGMPRTYYAWSSNIVYVFQLFVVSGWRPLSRKPLSNA